MKITDIVKAINTELKKIEGVSVISDDIRSGFEDKKPAFFVQLTMVANSQSEAIFTANIHFFPKKRTQLELLKMNDRLNDLFGNFTLQITEDEKIHIDEIRADFRDNVLQYRFDMTIEKDINLFDEKDYVKMEHLEMEGV